MLCLLAGCSYRLLIEGVNHAYANNMAIESQKSFRMSRKISEMKAPAYFWCITVRACKGRRYLRDAHLWSGKWWDHTEWRPL